MTITTGTIILRYRFSSGKKANLLQAFQIKRRCVFFFCTGTLLHKAFIKPQGKGLVQNFFIFIGRDAPVDLRVILCPEKRKRGGGVFFVKTF